jgi:hypothetical protein
MGPIERYMADDHRRLEALLEHSVSAPEGFDAEAFEQFRAGLLRHIGIEEKVLLPDAKRRRGGVALQVAERLRVEHSAIASLLVPTPDAALAGEIRLLLERHNPLEEGPRGAYAACDALAAAEVEALLERARAAPPVPMAKHFDGAGTWRRAEDALHAAEAQLARRKSRSPSG